LLEQKPGISGCLLIGLILTIMLAGAFASLWFGHVFQETR
jgi:hypothetical protein